MSNAGTTIDAPTSAPAQRESLLGRFMHRFATPLTTGLFLVSTVSGVALFFHWQSTAFHAMHEWLSMVLLAPFIFHVWKNWRPLVGYARRGTLVIPLLASIIVAAPFAYNGLMASGRGGNPGFRAVSLLTQAKLSDLAPVLRTTPDSLLDTLKQKGFPVQSAADSLAGVAKAAGKEPFEALSAVLPNQQRPAR